jgi:flagellar hook assembly protein FlgD
MLYQNYPNPFNPSKDGYTRIEYSLQNVIPANQGIQLSHVSIKVYNIAFDLVRTLLDKEVVPGNKTYVDWDGKNENNELVSDGVYIIQIKTPDYTKFIKVLLIK